jgi:type IV secretory pathway VirJ component
MKRTTRYLLIAVMMALLVGVASHLLRPPPQASLRHLLLDSGTELQLAAPGTAAQHRVLLVVSAGQQLNDAELLELAQSSQALIGQYVFREQDCSAQAHLVDAAQAQLGGPIDLLAGSDNAAMLAWRWLAGQNNDQAQALSVGFTLANPDCALPPPTRHSHGHWLTAWNDTPDESSARFTRQAKATPLIGNYDSTPKALLISQLRRLLEGAADALPVIEVPAQDAQDTVSLFYSGDGGWRDLDRAVAEQMALRGYPAVGLDALRYFWQRKGPEQAASDLSRLMQEYREKWHSKRFVLIGYSFGADVMPALYNRLPDSDKQQIDAIVLLALARSGAFEIHVDGWLGKDGNEVATGPELIKLPAAKVLCVYGEDEAQESGCTQEQSVGETLKLPGGHHYDEDYPALAERLIAAIKKRQSGP